MGNLIFTKAIGLKLPVEFHRLLEGEAAARKRAGKPRDTMSCIIIELLAAHFSLPIPNENHQNFRQAMYGHHPKHGKNA